jgi:hypothetical protein
MFQELERRFAAVTGNAVPSHCSEYPAHLWALRHLDGRRAPTWERRPEHTPPHGRHCPFRVTPGYSGPFPASAD